MRTGPLEGRSRSCDVRRENPGSTFDRVPGFFAACRGVTTLRRRERAAEAGESGPHFGACSARRGGGFSIDEDRKARIIHVPSSENAADSGGYPPGSASTDAAVTALYRNRHAGHWTRAFVD